MYRLLAIFKSCELIRYLAIAVMRWFSFIFKIYGSTHKDVFTNEYVRSLLELLISCLHCCLNILTIKSLNESMHSFVFPMCCVSQAWSSSVSSRTDRIREHQVKVQVCYSLISCLKTYHRTLHFTPWSLDLFIHVPFQLPGEHTVLQPFRRIELIVHIAISVLPGTHFHLSQVKHLRVKCLAQGHTILTMSQDWEGRNMIFLWKLHQTGFVTARQAATSEERHALTIAPCPSSLWIQCHLALVAYCRHFWLGGSFIGIKFYTNILQF